MAPRSFLHLLTLCGFLSAASVHAVVPSSTADSRRILTVLTYDSLMAEGGLGPELVSRFEKGCECRVKVQVVGDAAQMVSRLQLERVRARSETQVVVGVDQMLWPQVRSMALRWTAEGKFEHEVEPGFTPLDYGILGWIWNPDWKGFSGGVAEAPSKWSDLLYPKWLRLLLLQDPRTSSPGLGFVIGARVAQGASAPAFFRELRRQWMTLPAGWSGSYEIFLLGGAPLVWSYTTSQAYHLSRDPKSRLRAVVFDEGNPLQIEGAFIVEAAVRDPESLALARRFVGFLASREIQELIPSRQWMLPALKGVSLPREFLEVPAPKKLLVPSSDLDLRAILKEWELWIR